MNDEPIAPRDPNVVHVDFRKKRRLGASSGGEGAWGHLEAELDDAWRRVHLPPTEPVADVFAASEVTRLTGLTAAQLKRLDRQGVVAPSSEAGGRRAYTFRDLVVLRAVQGLLASGVKMRVITASLQALRAQLPKSVRALSDLRVLSNGDQVMVRTGQGPYEPLTGQMVLDFEVGQLRDDVVRLLRPKHAPDRRSLALAIYTEACVLDEDPASAEEAAELYERAIEYDPKLSLAYTNLGNIRHRQGRQTEAFDLYHRALDIDPHQPEALYNVGFCLLHNSRPGAAIPFFEQAIESNPSFADAFLYLAMCCELTGARDPAQVAWRRYLALEPEGEWADYAREHL